MKNTASRAGSGPNRFAAIPSVNLPRSTFDRSHGHQTTFDAGYLIPVYVDEVLPGDTVKLRTSSFVRMATPLKPVMDNMYLDIFFFSVPLRLLWDNFQKFMGEQDNPGDSTDFLTPITTSPGGGYAANSLQDYMGIPPGVAGLEHNSFHMRAYNLIYNQWFRPQDITDSKVVDTDDGPDTPGDYVLLRRGKRHDYFTAALPFPQKGPAVPLPLGTTAPVIGSGNLQPEFTSPGSTGALYHPTVQTGIALPGTVGGAYFTSTGSGTSGASLDLEWSDPKLVADLSMATAATINSIRTAFQIQKLYERDARGGTRYTEIVRSHFSVISPDARLQRPEYLGGGSSKINVHPVAVTAATVDVVGTLAAYATGGSVNQGFVKSFTEHAVLIGLAMVRADLRYQQGLNRMWSRRTRFDYFWPSFQSLGEQEVLSREIFADGSANDDDIFGYQERYAEYRYKPSVISGTFRSSHPQSLDVWHLAQDFATRPVLNDTFIDETPPMDRVIAVPSEPDFLADFWFSQNHVRPMPTYGVPGLVDHF